MGTGALMVRWLDEVLTAHPILLPRLKVNEGSYTSAPSVPVMACYGVIFTFPLLHFHHRNVLLLGTFAKLQKATISFIWSVHLCGTTPLLPVARFSLNLVVDYILETH